MDGLPDVLREMRFVDLEASGLHAGSYPIEVGWCGLDLEPVSTLVRPLPEWERGGWDRNSEAVHGISRKDLEGAPPAAEVGRMLARALEGRTVYSDAPGFDWNWMRPILEAAGEPPKFRLRPVEEAWALCAVTSPRPVRDPRRIMEIVEAGYRGYAHTHRAAADCLRLAAGCRALADPAWRLDRTS